MEFIRLPKDMIKTILSNLSNKDITGLILTGNKYLTDLIIIDFFKYNVPQDIIEDLLVFNIINPYKLNILQSTYIKSYIRTKQYKLALKELDTYNGSFDDIFILAVKSGNLDLVIKSVKGLTIRSMVFGIKQAIISEYLDIILYLIKDNSDYKNFAIITSIKKCKFNIFKSLYNYVNNYTDLTYSKLAIEYNCYDIVKFFIPKLDMKTLITYFEIPIKKGYYDLIQLFLDIKKFPVANKITSALENINMSSETFKFLLQKIKIISFPIVLNAITYNNEDIINIISKYDISSITYNTQEKLLKYSIKINTINIITKLIKLFNWQQDQIFDLITYAYDINNETLASELAKLKMI